jgi:hypothetical protein
MAPQASIHTVPEVPGRLVLHHQLDADEHREGLPVVVPRRRALLAAGAVPLLLAAAGCRSSDVFAGPDPLAGRPPLGHDVLTLQAVITAEEHLIGLYRAAIGADHVTASRSRTLGSLLSQHEQHLTQLKARLVIPPGATPSPSPPAASGSARVSAGAAGSPAASPRPGRVGTARLRAAERASAASLVRQLASMPPGLAQLFASIAASDATHVTVLGG